MRKPQKVKIVENLKEKISKAKSLVLTDYRGLTHQQLEEIKKAVKKVDGEFIVAKNTLLERALEIPKSSGPTATLLSYGDAFAPLGILAKFIKNFNLPKIKLGLIDDKTYNETEVLQIAALPSREVLAATVVTRLKGPIYGFHRALIWNLQRLTLALTKVAESKA